VVVVVVVQVLAVVEEAMLVAIPAVMVMADLAVMV
jgi:hypothetical protein